MSPARAKRSICGVSLPFCLLANGWKAREGGGPTLKLSLFLPMCVCVLKGSERWGPGRGANIWVYCFMCESTQF